MTIRQVTERYAVPPEVIESVLQELGDDGLPDRLDEAADLVVDLSRRADRALRRGYLPNHVGARTRQRAERVARSNDDLPDDGDDEDSTAMQRLRAGVPGSSNRPDNRPGTNEDRRLEAISAREDDENEPEPVDHTFVDNDDLPDQIDVPGDDNTGDPSEGSDSDDDDDPPDVDDEDDDFDDDDFDDDDFDDADNDSRGRGPDEGRGEGPGNGAGRGRGRGRGNGRGNDDND